jgi:hypothetical protein
MKIPATDKEFTETCRQAGYPGRSRQNSIYCFVCGEPRRSDSILCEKHSTEWRIDGKNYVSVNTSSHSFREWCIRHPDSNITHLFQSERCGNCDEVCPEDDYLCEACRISLYPSPLHPIDSSQGS